MAERELTPEQRAEAKAVCGAATPGPWVKERGRIQSPHGMITLLNDADHTFAAQARTLLPATLRDLNAADKEIARLQAALDEALLRQRNAESVPVAESPPVRMSLASTHSREYWPRGGGALLRVLPTMNPSSDCEWALIDAIQKAMERRWYWMCLDSPFGPPDDALHTAGFATGALMFERGDGIVR